MIKKIFVSAAVAFILVVSGCSQDLPPTENPASIDKPNVTQPENPPPVDNSKSEVPKTAETPPPVAPATENPPTVNPAPQPHKIALKVYYPDDAGINLVAVNRTVEVKADSEKYLAAVRLLMKNPDEKDLTVIFPKNAKINSVKVENGTAYVDFDKNITKSFVGGSTGEELLVNSVVKTLGEFGEVQQVRFLIDGANIETLSGHMDLSEPIKKSDL